jgi:hypothetical protein
VNAPRKGHIYGLAWTYFGAGAASNTAPNRKPYFNPVILGLRAVTKDAPEGTALEKHNGADSRSIFQAASFYIDKERLHGRFNCS